MVKDAFAWMDTPESTVSVKPLEPLPTITPDQTVPSLAPPTQSLPTEHVSAIPDLPELMTSVFNLADVELTATITDSVSVSATPDSTESTELVSPELLAHLPAPEMLKEPVSAMLASPCTVTIVPDAHSELSSIMPLKNVFLSVDKTQHMMPLNKDASVSVDTEFSTRFAPSAQPITSSKTTIVSLAQSTLTTIQPAEDANAKMDSF